MICKDGIHIAIHFSSESPISWAISPIPVFDLAEHHRGSLKRAQKGTETTF